MKNFLDVLDQLKAVLKEFNLESGDVLYRGHSKNAYTLVPSLLRAKPDTEDERAFFSECLIQGRSILPNEGLTWRMMSVFQHYGIPTRLLDWSDSFATALYFALAADCSHPHIWIANPFGHNQACTRIADDSIITIGVDPFPEYTECFLSGPNCSSWPSSAGAPIFMEIPWTTDRVRAQRGYFSAHFNNEPLDRIAGKCARRIDIPEGAIPDARWFLELAGVNDYSVFPDLHGLGLQLRKKYGL